MKLNLVQTLIAISLSALMAFGIFNYNQSENSTLFSIGGFLFLSSTLIFLIATNFEFPRTTTNIRALSVFFFLIALTINLIYTFAGFSAQSYIIVNGFCFVTFFSILNLIYRSKQ